tara:strand:- start:19335 stop:20201 length:867 start_codon:yes stop_codon:yes gene_type:complete
VQALTKWLLARPLNAVLALTVSLVLPIPQLTGGIIIVFLTLVKGLRNTAVIVFTTALLPVLTSLIIEGSLTSILTLLAMTWFPAIFIAFVLLKTQSLTLSLQVILLASFVFLVCINFFIPNLSIFWQPYLDLMAQLLTENGMQYEVGALTADILTISVVFIFWLIYSTVLLFGYFIYVKIPGKKSDYGKFQDLDFGKIIGIALVFFSILAFSTGSIWLQYIAITIFAMFMMQGLSILHWLKNEGIVQPIIVAVVYIVFPIFQIFLVAALAIVGYVDVWLGIRHRFKKS